MSTLAQDPLQELMSPQYEERINALELILEAEREALLGADYVGLEQLVRQKQALLEQMHPQLDLFRKLQISTSSDPRWIRIRESLARNRRINQQNGRLIAQAERHVRDALSILRGDGSDSYDSHGNRGGTATRPRPLGSA